MDARAHYSHHAALSKVISVPTVDNNLPLSDRWFDIVFAINEMQLKPDNLQGPHLAEVNWPQSNCAFNHRHFRYGHGLSVFISNIIVLVWWTTPGLYLRTNWLVSKWMKRNCEITLIAICPYYLLFIKRRRLSRFKKKKYIYKIDYRHFYI